jgi:hypothetical protein
MCRCEIDFHIRPFKRDVEQANKPITTSRFLLAGPFRKIKVRTMNNMQFVEKMLTELCTDAHFEVLLQIVDRLHDAAAAGRLETVTPMDAREVMGWLDDIIYTAEETMRELQATLEANEEPSRGWSDN